MLRLIKWLLYLVVLGFIALVAYVYIGPFLGADFTPETREIRQDILIETD
jgi:hypothetical protein